VDETFYQGQDVAAAAAAIAAVPAAAADQPLGAVILANISFLISTTLALYGTLFLVS